jgi:WD40 repeat protein
VPWIFKKRSVILRSFGAFAACYSACTTLSYDRKAEKPSLHEVRIERLSKFVLAFDICKGSNLAAVALSDLRVRVWRLDSGQVERELSFPEPETDERLKLDKDVEPISLRFSPDGKTLAVGFIGMIHLYDVETWQEKLSLGVAGEDKLRPDITATHPTPQLRQRTAAEAQAEKVKPVPTLNEATKARSRLMERGDGRTRILSFEFARDGSFILATYCRGDCFASAWTGHRWMFPTGKDPVRLWDLRSANVIWERLYDPKGVMDRVVLSPDSKRFAAVNAQLGHCAVGVYELNDGRPVWSQPLGPCAQPPSIQFLQDGSAFLTNRMEESNHKNKLWREAAIYDTSTGKKISDLSDHEGVGEADISSDGRWLASTTWGGRHFQVWDLQEKKIVLTQEVREGKLYLRLDRIRFSPDSRWLVVGSNISGDLAVYQFGARQLR